jgi:hypothetical protein
MNKICVIGLEQRELEWVRLLIELLRHPDPVVGKVSREALRYLESVAARADKARAAG